MEQREKWDRDTIVFWIFIGIVVLVLGLMGYGLYLLFTTTPPEVVAAVVVASGTILVSVLTYFFSRQQERSLQQLERQRELEQKQHQQKAVIYEEFMAFWFKMLTAEKLEPVNQAERQRYLNEFSQKLIAWGSENFLQAYLSFRAKIVFEEYEAFEVGIDEPENVERLLAFERVLFTIRSDLGYSNEAVQPGVLLTIFLNDKDVEKIHKIMQSSRERPQLPSPQEDRSREHV